MKWLKLAIKQEIIEINLYLLLALVAVHFGSSVVYQSLIDLFDMIVNKFFSHAYTSKKVDLPREDECYEDDEELVKGINIK